ncbi:glycerol-3-phosphate dehydrogenase/oxidase [Micromonospora sp. URMC 103]|uniref:glycerol-3-phosphate dehydrogenase/oxidase n=1 Tax=Micromonospora sp. URMC 103 TaxID=3423406 RepID=UPI003F1B3B8F
MRPVALSPQFRERSLATMAADGVDVLVVGGGVVGAGCALDAATRGLRVGLVEARDFAAGTSSRSSKLIHGGLRYLEMLDFGLVAEALKERSLLLNDLAPHLVRPVSFMYPLMHRGWERLYVGAGVALYDGLSLPSRRPRGVPGHRHLSRRKALALAPALRENALVGAIQYYDAQVDDARYTLSLARTAAAYGAHVASQARVMDFTRSGDRVTGAVVHDPECDRTMTIAAKHVVNATGVWTNQTRALAGGAVSPSVRASKGTHLVVPRDRINAQTGMILRTEKSVLFVIPWGRHWLVGTTDTDWGYDNDDCVATRSDVDYLLARVNTVLQRPLTSADVEGVYAGLRPLLSGDSDLTTTLSREHTVASPRPGLTIVAGGKFTTYRVMAQDAVDAAVADLRGLLQWEMPESCTAKIPLLGADGYPALWNSRHAIAENAALPVHRVEHLLRRYGSLLPEVLSTIEDDAALAEPVHGAEDYLRAEIMYAVTHEGARNLEDVLTRRTHVRIETFDRGLRCAEEVAGLVARAFGWSAGRVATEVENYQSQVALEREHADLSDEQLTDFLQAKVA